LTWTAHIRNPASHQSNRAMPPFQTETQRRILEDMGIDVWLPKETAAMAPPSAPSVEIAPADVPVEWKSLQEEVESCQRCQLSSTRTQVVFGSGDKHADVMLIGEAPGVEEDRQGLPFVGKAGKLLDAMLFAIGLSRDRVYVCNVVKCRPPNNRNPQSDEINACASYLDAQIEYVNPRVILALGKVAAHRLLQTEAPVYKMRGESKLLPGSTIPVVVTYHPASLLRNPEQKAQSWQDLCKVRQLLENAQV
jgi:uracil-DNA glycosylase family 4